MIMYSFVDGSQCEERYYFNYGAMIFEMIADFVPSEDEFSPFYPPIQHYFGDILEADATTFFRKLVPYDWTQTTKWPLPIYDWTTTPENKKNSEILREFLLHYLFPKYWDCFMLPRATSDDAESKSAVWRAFFNRFMQLLVATWYKHVPLIKLYNWSCRMLYLSLVHSLKRKEINALISAHLIMHRSLFWNNHQTIKASLYFCQMIPANMS